MARQVQHTLLRGGIDLVSTSLTVDPGRIWTGVNYVPVDAGYERILGYERVDGRPKPSEAFYWIVPYTLDTDEGDEEAEIGDEIYIRYAPNGHTSPRHPYAFATVISEGSDESGPFYVIGDIAQPDGFDISDRPLDFSSGSSVVLPTDVFNAGGLLTNKNGGMTYGVTRSISVRNAATSILADFSFATAATDERRRHIEAVPGTGPIRGVWEYKGDIYAVRDGPLVNNPDPSIEDAAVDAQMWKTTENGWVAVTQRRRTETFINFRTGSRAPPVGAVIYTGLTDTPTGARATVVRTEVASGAYGGNNAAGKIYVRNRSGGAFGNGRTLSFSDSGRRNTFAATPNSGTVQGSETAESELPLGGRYEFRNHNFQQQADAEIMIGVNGVGPAFTFDGTTLTLLSTGHADDRPTHLAIHANHLLLGYRGGSLIVSGTGNPTSFDTADGAAEIVAGQEIIGFEEGIGVGNTLIMGRDRMQVLYGRLFDADGDARLEDQTGQQTGGIEWTLQSVGAPIYMDARGIRTVAATDAYGNFQVQALSAIIQPWLDQQRNAANVPVSSMRVRSKDQYRVFLDSGIGVVAYFGRGQPEFAFIDYEVPVRCSVSAEDDDRIERVYFGSDDGWVFEAERGRSFDGRTLTAHVRLPLNHVGTPTQKKRWHKLDIHTDVESGVQLGIAALFDDGDNPPKQLEEQIFLGGGAVWDESIWNEVFYESPLNGIAHYDLFGFGRNVSVLIRSRSRLQPSHVINAMSLHYSPRREER